MTRVSDWIEYALREAVIGVAGAIALHAERNKPPGDPIFPPRPESDQLAAGAAALTAVSLVGLSVGKRVVCGLLLRRPKPTAVARTRRRA